MSRIGWRVPSAFGCAIALLLSTLPAQVSAAPRGPLIASGTLLDATGRATSGTVGIWYHDPASGELVLVGSSPVSNDGSFALHAATSNGILRRVAAANDGWVNLLVAGGTGTAQGSVAVTRHLGAGSWTGPRNEIEVEVRAAAPVLPDERADAASFAATARSAPGASALAAPIGGCTPVAAGTWRGLTVIGEVHTWTHHTAKWSYGRTADSDIGVGVTYDGRVWSQSGAFHVGTSSSSVVTKRAGSLYGRLLLSRFEFRRIAWVGFCPFVPREMIMPSRWLSGLVEGANVQNYDGYCGSYYAANAAEFGPHTLWSRNRSDYATFNAAVSAFGVVSLSARSGLSTNVKMTHTFGTGKVHRLCGNDGDILHASRVFAG